MLSLTGITVKYFYLDSHDLSPSVMLVFTPACIFRGGHPQRTIVLWNSLSTNS